MKYAQPYGPDERRALNQFMRRWVIADQDERQETELLRLGAGLPGRVLVRERVLVYQGRPVRLEFRVDSPAARAAPAGDLVTAIQDPDASCAMFMDGTEIPFLELDHVKIQYRDPVPEKGE